MNKSINPPHVLLEHIILMSLSFDRAPIITIEDKSKVSQNTSVDVTPIEVQSDQFAVQLTVDHSIKYDEKNIVSIKVAYSGTFKKIGENTAEELDTFLNVNAPAIIFPFVREVIASMTSKAMVGAILIQPVNFVELYKSKRTSTE